MENQTADWPEKKEEIVKAAIAVVAEDGLDKTTTARIARNAGVGEGTIYRYFKSKDELILTAAVFTSEKIFAKPRENYDPRLPVHSQFLTFCKDFLGSGSKMTKHHCFLEQFIESPVGARYRRETLKALETNPDIKPLIYPINRIFLDGLKQGVVKDLPLMILVGLTLPSLTFMLKHADQGFFQLNDELVAMISRSCWAAVRR